MNALQMKEILMVMFGSQQFIMETLFKLSILTHHMILDIMDQRSFLKHESVQCLIVKPLTLQLMELILVLHVDHLMNTK